MPLILPARTLDSGFNISNSLRFNKGDSSFLNRQFSGANTSRKTLTLSFWVKRTNLGSPVESPISAETNDNDYDQVIFTSTDQLDVNNVASASDVISFKTTAKFRDSSAWYHIVIAIDTTQASASNGIKIYINGVLETSFASSTYAQNATFEIGRDGSTTSIGRRERDGDGHGVGYLSDFYYIDGQQLTASEFGETNDNGVWIPKKYSGSYGNNGFLLEFKSSGTSQNSSGMGADTSGNDEHFAVTNLTANDVCTDSPTNNFCTFNPLTATGGTYSEGNTVITTGSNASRNERGTFGMDNGKWYWEYKLTGSSIDNIYLGIGTTDTSIGSEQTGTYTYYSSGSTGRIYTGGSIVATPTAFAVGDIVSIGYNADDNQVLFYLNGSLVHTTSSVTDITYNPFARIFYTTSQVEANFGNPSFAISSGNTDGKYGNFEYAVPSGYYALCTKNLAEYG